MRLVTVTVLGTALVAAGMLAPATGEATATGRHGVVLEPGMVRPGERVRVEVPGCAGRVRVVSEAFTGRAVGGTATVKQDVAPSTYAVVAHCGSRKVTGEVRVAGRLAWPDLLPSGHSRQ
ncbi:hypothetical protein ABZ806_31655 [Spirillospora sp. NPDC047418]